MLLLVASIISEIADTTTMVLRPVLGKIEFSGLSWFWSKRNEYHVQSRKTRETGEAEDEPGQISQWGYYQ